MEVYGRGAWHGRGCIDCVRLVRREEIRRDREREREMSIEVRDEEVKERRETTVVETEYVSGDKGR